MYGWWMGQGRMARAQLQQLASFATCNLLLCSAQAVEQTSQPTNQPGRPRVQDSPGAPAAGGALVFFLLLFLFSSLLGPPLIKRLMGWEICEWWQAGIIQDKRACDVLRFLSCPQLENRPARLGISHQRRPARYLTAAYAGTRSTQHRPRHRPHRNPEFQYPASPSRTSDPGGMTPAWARARRRITYAPVVMEVGLMPVLECHHGHGRARRPLCRSSLWPMVSSPLSGLLRPSLPCCCHAAAPSLLPVRPRPPVSCLRL